MRLGRRLTASSCEELVKFVETELAGAWILELEPHADERGFFARAWAEDELAAHGLATRVSQCNVSYNARRGTLRGLHWQAAPHEEAKVVRCTRGSVYDVIVDLRPELPTFRRWTAVELSAENRRALYIPEGFAHGFQTLVDDAELFYVHSAPHAPGSEHGARWDDPALAIEWPLPESPILSDRDRGWSALSSDVEAEARPGP